MIEPPKYPRTPYLWRDDGRAENVVPPGEREAWFRTPVVVEEKLDGANVSLWLDDGQLRVASRGGAEAMDRAGQLGRLRAWGAQRHQAFIGGSGRGNPVLQGREEAPVWSGRCCPRMYSLMIDSGAPPADAAK